MGDKMTKIDKHFLTIQQLSVKFFFACCNTQTHDSILLLNINL